MQLRHCEMWALTLSCSIESSVSVSTVSFTRPLFSVMPLMADDLLSVSSTGTPPAGEPSGLATETWTKFLNSQRFTTLNVFYFLTEFMDVLGCVNLGADFYFQKITVVQAKLFIFLEHYYAATCCATHWQPKCIRQQTIFTLIPSYQTCERYSWLEICWGPFEVNDVWRADNRNAADAGLRHFMAWVKLSRNKMQWYMYDAKDYVKSFINPNPSRVNQILCNHH